MARLYNVDNMDSELIDCVIECYRDEIEKNNEDAKELVSSILRYLYSITDDKNIQEQIKNIVQGQLGYCIICGNKYATITYEEIHDETSPSSIEYLSDIVCPCCDL